MRSFRFVAAALAEYDQAAGWYASRSAAVALDFVAAVEQSIATIRELPSAAPQWPDRPALRRHLVKGFPYLVVYLLDNEAIVIVALAHAKRQPGYWLGRVRRRSRRRR